MYGICWGKICYFLVCIVRGNMGSKDLYGVLWGMFSTWALKNLYSWIPRTRSIGTSWKSSNLPAVPMTASGEPSTSMGYGFRMMWEFKLYKMDGLSQLLGHLLIPLS